MKKRLCSIALTLALTLGLSVPALAAEEAAVTSLPQPVAVQLDGQPLTFTDAQPQVKDSRTFLPYRAVFEAMGATVSNEGKVLTAVRGDTTLTMTIGEPSATLSRNGKTETLTMDVAPYVDSATWRTYVPVRFAADAFGCNVGWDQDAQTAVIVDVEKLTDGLLTGENYTVLTKFLDYYTQFTQGNWACNGSVTGKALFLGSDALTVDGTVSGIMSGSSTAEMAVNMNMDMTGLMTIMTAMQDTTPEAAGITPEQMKMAMDMNMKMDLTNGTYLFRYNDAMNAQMGLPAGAWLSMDMGKMFEEMDLDLDALKNMDLAALLKSSIASYDLNNKSTTGYTELTEVVSELSAMLSDKNFQRTDVGYVAKFALDEDGVTVNFTLTLTADSKDQITGYTMTADMAVVLPEDVAAQAAQLGVTGADTVTFTMTAGIDDKNLSVANIKLAMGELFSFTMDMDCTYAKTDKAPNTSLPEGTTVVNFDAMLAELATAAPAV